MVVASVVLNEKIEPSEHEDLVEFDVIIREDGEVLFSPESEFELIVTAGEILMESPVEGGEFS